MSEAYRSSGVDTEAAAKAVTLIADLAAQARRPEVAGEVGGFAGLFSIGGGRLLAAATDGVGTKLEFARITGRLDTVGIDLVAMCADDVVCTGAEPLFFLDYLAVGRVVPEHVASVVEGIVEGCRLAGCALLGGETAEHPGVMAHDRFDLAGFCVGIVGGEQVLGPERVRPGDALIGLPSSGLHANGFSLVRTVVTPDELAIAPPAIASSSGVTTVRMREKPFAWSPLEGRPISASPGRTRSGPSTCSPSTIPTQNPARSNRSSAMTPGCSAVSPPRSAQPARRHPSTIPSTTDATSSGTTRPTAR